MKDYFMAKVVIDAGHGGSDWGASYMGRKEKDDTLNIAIVGKPNAGKSSLTNKILGYNRVIVSSLAGTTRDSIDTPFEFEGR